MYPVAGLPGIKSIIFFVARMEIILELDSGFRMTESVDQLHLRRIARRTVPRTFGEPGSYASALAREDVATPVNQKPTLSPYYKAFKVKFLVVVLLHDSLVHSNGRVLSYPLYKANSFT